MDDENIEPPAHEELRRSLLSDSDTDEVMSQRLTESAKRPRRAEPQILLEVLSPAGTRLLFLVVYAAIGVLQAGLLALQTILLTLCAFCLPHHAR